MLDSQILGIDNGAAFLIITYAVAIGGVYLYKQWCK